MTMHYLPKKTTLFLSVLALLLATLFGSVSGGNQLRGGATAKNLVRSDESSSTSSSLFSSSTVDEDDAGDRVLRPLKRRNRNKRNKNGKKNKSSKAPKATKAPKVNKSKSAKKNPKKNKSEDPVAVETDAPTASPTPETTSNVVTDSPTVAPTPATTFAAIAVARAAFETGATGCDDVTFEAAFNAAIDAIVASARADWTDTNSQVVNTACDPATYPSLPDPATCYETTVTITSNNQGMANDSVAAIDDAVVNGGLQTLMSTQIPSSVVGLATAAPISSPTDAPTFEPSEEPSEAPSEEPSETPTAS